MNVVPIFKEWIEVSEGLVGEIPGQREVIWMIEFCDRNGKILVSTHECEGATRSAAAAFDLPVFWC